MAHPSKSDVQSTMADKLRRMVTSVPHTPYDPWKVAERISGAKPLIMERPPEEAVPQFENDRSIRDVAYGSKPDFTVDD